MCVFENPHVNADALLGILGLLRRVVAELLDGPLRLLGFGGLSLRLFDIVDLRLFDVLQHVFVDTVLCPRDDRLCFFVLVFGLTVQLTEIAFLWRQ